MASCFHCRAPLPFTSKTTTRSDTCPSCGRDVRACRNCSFYDESVNNKCREPQAEWVAVKDRSNFCEYFTLGVGVQTPTEISVQSARAKLDDLFKPKPAKNRVS